MFCKHCGNQIPDNATFCSHCGNAVQTTTPPTPPVNPYYAPQQGNGKFPVVSLVLGILGIILAIIPSIFYIGLILSIVGLVFGVKEKAATGKGVGLVLSIIGTCIGGVYLLLALIGLIFWGSLLGSL